MTISSLIDKFDNVEIVRDQVAALLVVESASQMALAVAAARDPAPWELRVFRERSNPWEAFPDRSDRVAPIINVWWQSSDFDASASNISERQKSTAVINIDCYGYGESRDDPAGGHTPGDMAAALETQRAIRVVRNILMAAEYTYLGLRGLVWRRWPSSITIFQPQRESAGAQHVLGARLALEVVLNEFSPQVEAVPLELLSTQVDHRPDGQVLLRVDYDYTGD